MKRLLLLSALLPTGCTVVGSAFVERDLPDGRAVARIEVHFAPPHDGGPAGRLDDPNRTPCRRRDVADLGRTPGGPPAPARVNRDGDATLAQTLGPELPGWESPRPPR
jgi:hypothetical protein